MEALDKFSTLIILIGSVIVLANLIRFIYNVVIDKPVTITNPKTGKSAQITRKYDKSQVEQLREVLN